MIQAKMEKIVFVFLILTSSLVYSQSEFFNEDGTVSNSTKQQILLEVFNKRDSDEVRYEIENNYLIIITKSDCGVEKVDKSETLKLVHNLTVQKHLNMT